MSFGCQATTGVIPIKCVSQRVGRRIIYHSSSWRTWCIPSSNLTYMARKSTKSLSRCTYFHLKKGRHFQPAKCLCGPSCIKFIKGQAFKRSLGLCGRVQPRIPPSKLTAIPWKLIFGRWFISFLKGWFLFKVNKFVHFRAKKTTAKTRPGSVGHPELCRRPCIYFAQGQCRNSADCSFWTLDPVVVCTTGLRKMSSKPVVNVRWIYSLQNSRKGWIFGFLGDKVGPKQL